MNELQIGKHKHLFNDGINSAIGQIAKHYGKPESQVRFDYVNTRDTDALVAIYEKQRKSPFQLLDLAKGIEVVCSKEEMLNVVKSGYFDNIEIEKQGSEYKLKTNYKNGK